MEELTTFEKLSTLFRFRKEISGWNEFPTKFVVLTGLIYRSEPSPAGMANFIATDFNPLYAKHFLAKAYMETADLFSIFTADFCK